MCWLSVFATSRWCCSRLCRTPWRRCLTCWRFRRRIAALISWARRMCWNPAARCPHPKVSFRDLSWRSRGRKLYLMMLVDSHCHLDYPEFADLDETARRAHGAGVGCMLTIGTSMKKFAGVLAVAEAREDIYCTVGVHPHEAGKEPLVTVNQLLEHAQHPKVIGFGETG